MRKIQIVLALVATFAFAAISAASASAEETLLAEWLVDGAALTGNVASVSEGELLLEDMGAGIDVLCSGKFVGTIGVDGADSITLVEDLEGKDNSLNCTLSAKGTCEEANGSKITVFPQKLPWTTKLVLMENGEFLDEITGEPGYLIECKIFGIKIDDTCTGDTQTQEKNITGGVESNFSETETITPTGNCTAGGAGLGLTVGSNVTTSPNGLTISSAEETLLAEWLVDGAALTGNVASVSEGELLLEDMGAGIDVLCSGKFVGTIGVDGADSITLVEDLEGKDNSLNCTLSAKGTCEEANGSKITVFPQKLPWTTKLVLMENGEFLDEITGEPGYLIECKIFGIKIDDTCTGDTQTQEKNITGGVESNFSETETITPTGNCTAGGAGLGLTVGSNVTTSPNGLTVSSE